jgi:glucose/arabinose dehydrogenase
MVFDRSGYLFLSVGDRGEAPNLMANQAAQSLAQHQGKVLRLHDDGRVPADNPFVGRAGAMPEIWSWGHRNPQGLTVHPVTGEIWENEHGPRGGDEVNLIRRGQNFGWPVVSFGVNYDGSVYSRETHREGMESPRWAFVPSIATSGLLFYTGDAFPWWQGSLFVGGMVGEQLARLTLQGERVVGIETLLPREVGRVRDVRQGPDGFIYLAIDGTNQQPLTRVVRLEPVAGQVAAPR